MVLILFLRLIGASPPHTTTAIIRTVCLHIRERLLDLTIKAFPGPCTASTIARAAAKPVLTGRLTLFPFCRGRFLGDLEGPGTRNLLCVYFKVFLCDFIKSYTDLLKPLVTFFHQGLIVFIQGTAGLRFSYPPYRLVFQEPKFPLRRNFESMDVRISRLDEIQLSFLFCRGGLGISGEFIPPTIGNWSCRYR